MERQVTLYAGSRASSPAALLRAEYRDPIDWTGLTHGKIKALPNSEMDARDDVFDPGTVILLTKIFTSDKAIESDPFTKYNRLKHLDPKLLSTSQ